jgi:hypothetical protein
MLRVAALDADWRVSCAEQKRELPSPALVLCNGQ